VARETSQFWLDPPSRLRRFGTLGSGARPAFVLRLRRASRARPAFAPVALRRAEISCPAGLDPPSRLRRFGALRSGARAGARRECRARRAEAPRLRSRVRQGLDRGGEPKAEPRG